MEDELQVKALLKGELLEKFSELKKYYRVEADAEVFRICITDAHRVYLERKSMSDKVKSEKFE